jgi:CDP-diacylglycerol--serine O-phosphatidyltransferase
MLKRRRFRRIPRPKGQTLQKIVPSIITVGALAAGLTSLRFALEGEWKYAVTAILVAAVLDALDGRMARLLKTTSDFGAELDSLSDVIAFGVAPAVVTYLWALSGVDGPGWIVAVFFVVCCALRLARFNTSLGKLPPYAYNYFTGVPAPAGAGLAILPLVASFEMGAEIIRNPVLVQSWLVAVGILMVSPLPTYSFKQIKVPHHYVLLLLVAAGMVVVALAGAPWRTLMGVGVLYLATLPFACRSYLRLRREAERLHAEMETDDIGDDEGPGDAGGKEEDASRPSHLRPV